MIWEIASVEEGDRPNDVILRVNYWHDEHSEKDEPPLPDRAPDMVEDHIVIGVPTLERYPKRTPIGQFVGLDGSPVMEWAAGDDGELVQIDPHDIADQIQWVEVDEDAKDDLLLIPVSERARQAARERLTGDGTLPAVDLTSSRFRIRGSAAASVAQQRRSRLLGRRGVA